MSWQYQQSTGSLRDPAGALAATGYSGAALGKNNAALQDVRNYGPVPRGVYDITGPECTGPAMPCPDCHGATRHEHGPFVLRLHARPANEMHGRDGFLMHGDNLAHTASHGCVIMARDVRERVAASEDRVLTVIA